MSSDTTLDLVTRDEWGAAPAKHQLPLQAPVPHVGWGWTCSDTCSDRESCGNLLRFLQRCNMDNKGLADIKYNFLVATDGTIYEGRGWLANTAAIDPKNDYLPGKFITVGRIGMDFEDTPLTPVELEAHHKIIEYGIRNGYIHPEWKDMPILKWLTQ